MGVSPGMNRLPLLFASFADDESMLQLIVGVSVGLGSGIIILIIIAVVCWVR